MRVIPDEYILVPDVGRCRVIAQHENRQILFKSPDGKRFSMDVQDLVSRIWTEFDREIEQDMAS